MIRLLLTMLCFGAVAPQQIDSVLQQVFPHSIPGCLRYTETPQSLFSSITFLVVDTSCRVVAPPSLDYPPLSLAIDSSGQVYHLFGFDSIEFNKLVAISPRQATPHLADSVAKFFLKTAILYDPYQYYFIPDVDSFISLQLQLGADVVMDNKPLDEKGLRKQLGKLRISSSNEYIIYNTIRSRYELNYCVWFKNDGALKVYSLSVTDCSAPRLASVF